MSNYIYRISEDRQRITLNFPEMGVVMIFSAHDFEKFIVGLARLRSSMVSDDELAIIDLNENGSHGGTVKRWVH